jgi:hypothetical protein
MSQAEDETANDTAPLLVRSSGSDQNCSVTEARFGVVNSST